jgi:tetratricopeptide (TPR) repeat protein
MAQTLSPTEVRIVDMASGQEVKRLAINYQNGYPTAFSHDGSELIVSSGYEPMVWWNLIRLDHQLQELGLAWDSTTGFANALSVASGNEPMTLTTDYWNNQASTPVKVVVDQGDLPRRIAARDEAKAVEVQLGLARTLGRGENWVLAKSALERALELSPDDATIQNELAWLLATCPDQATRDPSRAVELATSALQSQPERFAYHHTLGVSQFRAGNFQAAIDTLTHAEDLDPDRLLADTALFLAMAHWRLGNQTTAREWLETAARRLAGLKSGPDEVLLGLRAEAEKLLGHSSRPAPP